MPLSRLTPQRFYAILNSERRWGDEKGISDPMPFKLAVLMLAIGILIGSIFILTATLSLNFQMVKLFY